MPNRRSLFAALLLLPIAFATAHAASPADALRRQQPRTGQHQHRQRNRQASPREQRRRQHAQKPHRNAEPQRSRQRPSG